MKSISPYLNFDGKTEEAFGFYQSVFGGQVASMRYKEMPGSEGLPPEDKDRIMHANLNIGKNGMIMGSDVPSSMRGKLVMGTNTYIMLSPESEMEAERIFNALSAGGQVEMPLQKMFWGALYASWTDRFGVQWMVNFDLQRDG